MNGVLIGFLTIGGAIGLGFVLRRRNVLAPRDVAVLNLLAVRVATPALLFVTISATDVSRVFATPFAVTAVSAAIALLAGVVVALIRRWDAPRAVVTVLAGSYVNSSNLGIPIATYVLGSTALIGPLILFQQIVYLPLGLLALGIALPSPSSPARRILRAATSPIILASVLALIVAALKIDLAEWIRSPIALVGQFAVPAVLIAYGASLPDASVLRLREDRGPVLTAAIVKCLVHPLAAGVAGLALFGLQGADLVAVVLFAALPTAQNLYAYSSGSARAQGIAQRTIAFTTILSLPVIAATAIAYPMLR